MLQSVGVIVKERTKMEIIEKKKKTFWTREYWDLYENFKRAYKNFSIENGQFLYKGQRAAVMAKQQLIKEIIKEVHEGVSQRRHFKAMTEISETRWFKAEN